MNRDQYILAGFLVLFAAANVYLFGSGTLTADWDGFGVLLAAGLTLALYSFLYKDNPLFKFAEHVFVGVAAAYVFAQYWYQVLYAELFVRYRGLVSADSSIGASGWFILVPTVLGILMLLRLSQQVGWVSRVSFAFYVGLGAGLTIPRYVSSFVLAQIEPTLAPLTWSWSGVNVLLILTGVLAVLIYFFFSIEHTGAVGRASRVGIWFLMVSFGASFGYTVMARLSLLIGRVTFLLDSWLHVM